MAEDAPLDSSHIRHVEEKCVDHGTLEVVLRGVEQLSSRAAFLAEQLNENISISASATDVRCLDSQFVPCTIGLWVGCALVQLPRCATLGVEPFAAIEEVHL